MCYKSEREKGGRGRPQGFAGPDLFQGGRGIWATRVKGRDRRGAGRRMKHGQVWYNRRWDRAQGQGVGRQRASMGHEREGGGGGTTRRGLPSIRYPAELIEPQADRSCSRAHWGDAAPGCGNYS